MKFSISILGFILVSCSWNPTPTPEPTPPPPEPWTCELDMPGCHETDPPQTCSGIESPCWHNPTLDPEHCEKAPDCIIPDPPPPPPKPYPRMGVYWFSKKTFVADATPLICKVPLDEVPECYKGRYCHPVACENDPTRLEKEQALMGGDKPNWELDVSSGKLKWVYINNWKGKVTGKGKGRFRAVFPNGKAKSKWLEVEK